MPAFPAGLLDALLHRNDEQIEVEVRRRAGESGFPAALGTITQFAVLAFAPSEHSRAALFGLDALATLAETLEPDVLQDQLVELARYAAATRRPWSEAPITDPPEVTDADGSSESLAAALASRDRLAAERWIAAALLSEPSGKRFFDACATISRDMPDTVRVGATAWRIAERIPLEHRFGVLRVAAVQWTAEIHPADAESSAPSRTGASQAERAALLIQEYAALGGSPEILASIGTIDAAQSAWESTGSTAALDLLGVAPVSQEDSGKAPRVAFPATRPQLDYSGCLISWSVAHRRSSQWNADALARLCDTAAEAARSERWYEEWSI